MIPLEKSWQEALKEELHKPYLKNLSEFLVEERAHHTIYPSKLQVFNAFHATPFHAVKAVIVGQDPYHGPNQAHGLSFSVPPGIAIPPSLRNIYKELADDLHLPPPNHGCLLSWAKEGVLLLNAYLTVRANTPLSHSQIGWQTFTDAVISTLATQKKDLVFLLWGRFAQEKVLVAKKALQNHCVLTAAHPSPYSAPNGFFGCRHFSKTNQFLEERKITPINWKLINY